MGGESGDVLYLLLSPPISFYLLILIESHKNDEPHLNCLMFEDMLRADLRYSGTLTPQEPACPLAEASRCG